MIKKEELAGKLLRIASQPHIEIQAPIIHVPTVRVDVYELLDFIGPKWPVYVCRVADDPSRTGDTSRVLVYAQIDELLFCGVLELGENELHYELHP